MNFAVPFNQTHFQQGGGYACVTDDQFLEGFYLIAIAGLSLNSKLHTDIVQNVCLF